MKCQACHKGKLSRKSQPQIFTYKGKSIVIEQPGMWCNLCDEGILSGADIEATEQVFEEFKAKIDNLLPPQEIKRIRKNILRLTQSEAQDIFGGGKNAFSRYESGKIKPSLSLSNLLKMFERHPEDVKYFKERCYHQGKH